MNKNRLSGTLLPDKTLAALSSVMLVTFEENRLSGYLPNELPPALLALQLQGNSLSGYPSSPGVAYSATLLIM